MRHQLVLALALLLPLTAMSQNKTKPKSAAAKPSSPAAVHNSAIVVDTHADTTQRLLDEGFDMGNVPAGDQGHLDLAKAKAGNLNAEFFSIWAEPERWKGRYAHRTLALIDAVYQQAENDTRTVLWR
jgi:membrane dipeptidase